MSYLRLCFQLRRRLMGILLLGRSSRCCCKQGILIVIRTRALKCGELNKAGE